MLLVKGVNGISASSKGEQVCKRQVKSWTKKEIVLLESLIESVPMPELERKFGRSRGAIEWKARRLGFGATRATLDNYSVKYLATELGTCHGTVQHWIRQGWLKARKVTPYLSAISATDFAEFCEHYPKRIKRFNIEAIEWLCHR